MIGIVEDWDGFRMVGVVVDWEGFEVVGVVEDETEIEEDDKVVELECLALHERNHLLVLLTILNGSAYVLFYVAHHR